MDKLNKKHSKWQNQYKNKGHMCAVYKKNHLIYKRYTQMEVKRYEKKVFHSNENQKKSGISHLYECNFKFQERTFKELHKTNISFQKTQATPLTV